MSPLTPDLKMYPYLIMFDDGTQFNISNIPVYAIDEESALELASAEMWRGKSVWVYRGTDVHKAINEFRKTLED